VGAPPRDEVVAGVVVDPLGPRPQLLVAPLEDVGERVERRGVAGRGLVARVGDEPGEGILGEPGGDAGEVGHGYGLYLCAHCVDILHFCGVGRHAYISYHRWELHVGDHHPAPCHHRGTAGRRPAVPPGVRPARRRPGVHAEAARRPPARGRRGRRRVRRRRPRSTRPRRAAGWAGSSSTRRPRSPCAPACGRCAGPTTRCRPATRTSTWTCSARSGAGSAATSTTWRTTTAARTGSSWSGSS